jgi:xanthine dehydrogenase molybdopterin-binding subunit B
VADAKQTAAETRANAVTAAATCNAMARKEAAFEIAKAQGKAADSKREVGMARVNVERERVEIERKAADFKAVVQMCTEIIKSSNGQLEWSTAWKLAMESYKSLNQ